MPVPETLDAVLQLAINTIRSAEVLEGELVRLNVPKYLRGARQYLVPTPEIDHAIAHAVDSARVLARLLDPYVERSAEREQARRSALAALAEVGRQFEAAKPSDTAKALLMDWH